MHITDMSNTIHFVFWLFAFIPLAVVYGVVGAFLGYLMHFDVRDSGKWWADLPSTVGIVVGIVVAYALTSSSCISE